MATLVSALNTTFTPAVGDFIVQTSLPVNLVRRNTSGAAFRQAAYVPEGSFIVSNPVAGAEFQFRSPDTSTPTVQADQ